MLRESNIFKKVNLLFYIEILFFKIKIPKFTRNLFRKMVFFRGVIGD
ncbi:hypothetical protein M702_07665 [Neisseria gonorrhoeae SK28355]|nr:hypothetical protein M702_07665 [Neisseria gonorrhoeae SK28355]KLR92558.1 hypothetical protein M685_03500 [Neisseria gonorrhoeae SK16259]KLR97381.1 hypothetical protein M683_01975 [Neisseria gonorrhoeae SK14515]KLS05181.1 hypothetical protein M686_01190 [Neisseria gonorrhoeae SK16942]KLS05837.1 hypothetical protein M725_02895 [Neisseria gonorrhoeae ATL_2011_01_08]KLS17540.1 hypothetical protein M687_05640 [Neisseria gonorrhoeae SK17973]KLS17909.1 hypothetical protein M704_10805 [Neisseria 